jgi:small-conductance mechanosensitive channel
VVEGDFIPDNARADLIKDSLRKSAQKVIKSCFDFARAESVLLEETQPASDPAPKSNNHEKLSKRVEETQKRMEDMKQRLDEIAKQIPENLGSDRIALLSERERLNGELKVENAHLELLNNFTTILNTGNNDDTSLLGSINKLYGSARSDLEDRQSAKPAAKAAAADNAKDDSLLGTGSYVFSLSQKKKSISTIIKQTNDLNDSTQNMVKVLRDVLKNSIAQGQAIADKPVTPQDRQSLQAHQRDLDAWLAQYKKLSAVVVIPLGEIRSQLENINDDLKELSLIVDQQWDKIFIQFIIRFGVLCISLLVPFVFLELAHRAMIKYVKDINRMRQLNVVRQVVFVVLLVLVVFLNFFTEFGSLATYAGFLTAGIAVALQTVLVSLTAHFFFFGRFGVRAGDRVTITGVTGDVVQVGMLRIYLMELIGEEPNLRPSGKIVAFPNSVLFNPTAFSKQITGTSYSWNDLKFYLDPGSNFSEAGKKLLEAVESVYKEYKSEIERQHLMLQKSTNLIAGIPAPKSEIRIKDAGMVCEVHYPVITKYTSEVYEKIVKRLMAAFENDPKLKLVLSSPMRVVARNGNN